MRASRGPAPAGGLNIAFMLKSQNAMYWHADLQAALCVLFFAAFIIAAELGINGNVPGELYVCREMGVWKGTVNQTFRNTNVTVPLNCNSSVPLYPFHRWRGGINAMRIIMSLCSIATAASLVLYHNYKLALERLKGTVAPHTPLTRYPEGFMLLLEVVTCLFHPLPWLEEITTNSGVYLFLFTTSALRLYLPLRSLFNHSMLNSNAARFITSLSGITFNAAFIARSYLYLYPVRTLSGATAAIYFLSSYLLRMYEAVGCTHSQGQCLPMDLGTALFVVAITFVSVGYGGVGPYYQYVPISQAGKVIMGITSVFGVLLVLITVALALLTLQLDDTEEHVLNTWQKLRNKLKEKLVAARALQLIYRFHKNYKLSLEWATGFLGMKYRVVSTRVPAESAAVQAVLDFFKTRLELRRASLDEDYTLVKRVMAAKALVDVDGLLSALKPFSVKLCGENNPALTILESPNYGVSLRKFRSSRSKSVEGKEE